MGRNFSLQLIFNIVLYLVAWSRVQTSQCMELKKSTNMSIGGVLDLVSLMGKQQKIAMEIAVEEFNINQFSSSKMDLQIKDSHGNSAQVISSVMDLSMSNQVQAIIGTITHNEAKLANDFSDTVNNIPIISLTSFSNGKELLSPRLPHFIQVGDDINLHIQCMSAIVGAFRWKKVTVIYELNNDFSSDPGILLSLSYSLKLVGSEIDNYLAFPSLSTLSDPKTTIENELNNLKKKSNRVFLIVHSSLELANMLCEKANQIGLMEKGSVWIIPHEVAGLFDSVNSSVIFNMQGVVGFKTHFIENNEFFRMFKTKFQRKFALEYPEEDNISPSIFALQAYDATKIVTKAINKFGRLIGKNFSTNGKLSQSKTFNIINVIGKSYREMAFWSPTLGFFKTIVGHNKVMEISTNNDDSNGVFKAVYWPGESQTVPKGYNNEERSLKIAIPSNSAFTQFVNVEYDKGNNEPTITGFSINVFKAAIKHLPYVLNYKFFPFNGSYDEMVDHVYNKTFDAAVGDISIVAYRYHLVDFSQPYVESGLHMVVTEQPAKSKEMWMFMAAFTKEMWLMMIALHIFVGFIIWLIEREVNEDLKGFGSMLWFLVTVLFYANREPIKRKLAQVVLTPWLLAIFIVTNTFTASLTSITISQVKPSLDIQTLKERNSPIGCDGNSFIFKYLIEVLNIKSENIRNITSISDYPAAFKNKQIEAAFFVAPHAKVFLAKYSCKGFIKAGNTSGLGGFGFVFPKGSSLASDISEALLKIIESGEVEQLEKEMLNEIEKEGKTNCSSLEKNNGKDDSSIGLLPFLGLFLICFTFAILGFSYHMIFWLVKNVETLTSRTVLTLTQLWRTWRWITNFFLCVVQKSNQRIMRGVSSNTKIRNDKENFPNS